MILSAFGLSEISNGTILDNNLVHIVVLAIHSIEALFSLFFTGKLNVNITHHVLSDVVCYHKVQDLAEVGEFPEDFFEEVFVMIRCLQQLFLRYLEAVGKCHG